MSRQSLHRDLLRDLQVTRGTGLTIGVASGAYNISGVLGFFAGATNQPVADNTTNYVMLDSAGVLIINTSGWQPGALRLATVVTSGGSIPTGGITDNRVIVGNHGAGLGTGIWRKGTPTGTIDGVNDTFTIPTIPDPNSLLLILDGNPLEEGVGNDYTLASDTITFATPPNIGNKLIYYYTESTPQSPSPAQQLKVVGGQVDVGTSPAPAAGEILEAISATEARWLPNISKLLKNATGEVDISSSPAPSIGQVLTATGSSVAQWADLPQRGIYTFVDRLTWSNESSVYFSPSSGVLDPSAIAFKVVFKLFNENGSNPCIVQMNINNISTAVYDYTLEDVSTYTKTTPTGQGSFEIATIPGGGSVMGEVMIGQPDNAGNIAVAGMLGLSSLASGSVLIRGKQDITPDTKVEVITITPNQLITGTVTIYKLI